MKRPLVVYHAHCPDGFGGAWAAWKKFKTRAEYLAAEHYSDLPLDVGGRTIFLIDYCYSKEKMEDLVKKATVTVIDHHATNREAIGLAHKRIYNIENSGCFLAWNFFHPGVKVPFLLRSIQDLDLHLFSLAHTKELVSVLALHEYDFRVWNKLFLAFEDPISRKDLIAQGRVIETYKTKKIARILDSAEKITFHGVSGYAVNTRIFHSEAATAIYETLGVHLGISWAYKRGNLKVSLRSDGAVDVGKLSVRYGGGGHPCASGFMIPFRGTFPWKRV